MEVDGESSTSEFQAPDKTLAQLYKSARPPVDLIPGLSLSAMVNTAWIPSDAKVRTRIEFDSANSSIPYLKAFLITN
jgi:hypothetical protein